MGILQPAMIVYQRVVRIPLVRKCLFAGVSKAKAPALVIQKCWCQFPVFFGNLSRFKAEYNQEFMGPKKGRRLNCSDNSHQVSTYWGSPTHRRWRSLEAATRNVVCPFALRQGSYHESFETSWRLWSMISCETGMERHDLQVAFVWPGGDMWSRIHPGHIQVRGRWY